jgi:hypothetical protein
MGLIIDQGKQVVQEVKESQGQKSYDIIEAEQVQGVIEEITPHKFLADNLSVKVRIIEDPFKNRVVYGDANYNPTSKLNFTYQNLRTSAGYPYEPGENPQLDIEKLLMNKVVTMKLFIRTGKDGKEYQGVRWVPIKPSVLAPQQPELDKEKVNKILNGDDLFKDMGLTTEDPFKKEKTSTDEWEDPVIGDEELPF